MNSATANSSDTPSSTLMEVSPSCGDCRVWGHCPQERCKGTRARRRVGRKDGVKSGFMRGLHRGFRCLGGRYREQAPSHRLIGARHDNSVKCGRGLAPDNACPDAGNPQCKPRIKPLFTPSLRPARTLALVPLRHSCGQLPHTRHSPLNGETSMSVLDGVSLLLAVALFIYLLVALLRADRN